MVLQVNLNLMENLIRRLRRRMGSSFRLSQTPAGSGTLTAHFMQLALNGCLSRTGMMQKQNGLDLASSQTQI